jgi:NAD(P)H dehydrogenase (quinone)
MRIVVTGATGTVGRMVMRLLKPDAEASRLELVGGARTEARANELRNSGYKPVVLNYDQPETLGPALRNCDALFLATGYTVEMLVHSKRVLDAAKAEGVKHIVHLGALAPDDTPLAHFAWHQMVEHTIEAMGFSWTHLRPNFFMDAIWRRSGRRSDRVVHYVGSQRVSFICVEDIAAVAAEALKRPDVHSCKYYPLAVEALTFAEVAAVLSDVTGHMVEYEARMPHELLSKLEKHGAEPVYARSLVEGFAAIERGEMPTTSMVFDTVVKITGREPISWRDYARSRHLSGSLV